MLFDVPSMPDYGQLSKRPLDEMIAGARVEVAPYKKDPHGLRAVEAVEAGRAGVAVARAACAGPAGLAHRMLGDGVEASWARPSTSTAAASISSFRTTRTRSRSRAAPSQHAVMANYWMHNGFLQVEGEKMSKSLGNFFTIRDLLKDWPGEVLRFNMLRTHYRQPIDWTIKGLEESWKVLYELNDWRYL